MAIPSVKEVGTDRENFYGVRFRPPSQFEEYRTPLWATHVADSISRNSEVVMGRTSAGNWLVQSVLITKAYHSKREAKQLAKRIVQEIEA